MPPDSPDRASPVSTQDIQPSRATARSLEALRLENQRLRRLLELRGDTAPAPEQPVLASELAATSKLATSGPPKSPAQSRRGEALPLTKSSPSSDKLAFYGDLFRARRDVYARFYRTRAGEPGWAPATRGRWRSGAKARDQDLAPLTPQVVADHLSGNQTIGLYPLLHDNTCHFLAADFDGQAAMLDALAYLKAARSAGVPAALELSRSGNGAHVWFFFSEPVLAKDARALGISLVHEAITLRGSMSLASYDRLFPNQDTMPAGGFGNLIAAPLQRKCLERGTSACLSFATLEPWEDQWQYLSTLDRLSVTEVRRDRCCAGRVIIDIDGPEGARFVFVPRA